jgi:ubiquinone/menaquinone biosynthesis C-methylase UbiE
MLLDKNLEKVRQAYDFTVAQFRQGTDPYADLPVKLKNADTIKKLAADSKNLGSGGSAIKDYLNPSPGMKFLDAGCSANLYNYHLYAWPSMYYGVDISEKLITAMKGFSESKGITIGGLYQADVSDLPFDDDFFDIAAMIGVLEYCKIAYVKKALKELNRVLKPGARIVLDIPNQNHPDVKDMADLERYLKRPIYIRSRETIEKAIRPFFKIQRVDDSRVMTKYFLNTVK